MVIGKAESTGRVEGSRVEGDSSTVTSSMTFRLDPGSGVPTYLQLVHQVEQALRLGYLGPGDRLPRVKDVVATLVINPNTVLKAYRELETKGLTHRKARCGHIHRRFAPADDFPRTHGSAPEPQSLASGGRESWPR